jgi:ubiquinone/menaquinone biosynthesis C-methylase UbiE
MNTNHEPGQLDADERLIRPLVELRPQNVESLEQSLRAYDSLHAAGALVQRDSFYLWLLSVLDPQPGETLLDVSCGQGALVRFAQRAGLTASGLDMSPSAVAIARRSAPFATFTVGNAEQLPYPDGSFACVTNIGSVEHYYAPARAVREMARVLKSDGRALILVPNTFGLLGNILYVWQTGDVFDDGQPLQRYGTNGQWRRLLEANGLRITQTIKYERAWPRTWKDAAWYALRPYRLVRPLLSLVLPVHLSSFLVYLCSKP